MADPQPEKTIAFLLSKYLSDDISRIVYLNADIAPGSVFDTTRVRNILNCEQPNRPRYLELKNQGYEVNSYLAKSEPNYDICIIAFGKFREKNDELLARAKIITRQNGVIIIGGSKNTGIASAKKRIAKETIVEENHIKHHAVAFSFRNQGATKDDELVIQNQKFVGRFVTVSGLFSSNKIDIGSSMLANYFSGRLKGRVADLGAGWGYLSAQAIKASNNIDVIELFEAEWRGIESCRKNLEEHSNKLTIKYHWHDVPNEMISGKFDTVIMNPPFHAGKELAVGLGQQFIETASNIIKPKGGLFMVANSHLAYESLIRKCFTNMSVLQESSGFKIIHCVK